MAGVARGGGWGEAREQSRSSLTLTLATRTFAGQYCSFRPNVIPWAQKSFALNWNAGRLSGLGVVFATNRVRESFTTGSIASPGRCTLLSQMSEYPTYTCVWQLKL